MKILNIRILSILLLAIFYSCSSSGGDDGPVSGDDDDPIIPSPTAVTLTFPADDTECNTGEIESDLQSWVTFEWNASDNTDSYEINATNLDTNDFLRLNVTVNEARLLITRGAPYEWFVISKASNTNETATSETWRFYNEGLGVENHAPFPAEAISPARGVNLAASTSSVTLEWEASDVDNDISEYEVYFDITENPTTSLGTTPETSIADVAVTSGNTYYWKVVTTDDIGNSSTSEIFEFKVL